jgi:hypothetical protein
MKTQELGLVAIIITVCLSFFASVILSAFGKPVAPELQGVISTSFTALIVVVPTWLAVGRSEQQKRDAYAQGLNDYHGLKVGK